MRTIVDLNDEPQELREKPQTYEMMIVNYAGVDSSAATIAAQCGANIRTSYRFIFQTLISG